MAAGRPAAEEEAERTEPEGLPCPGCESTNTKVRCYNNYNPAQPRHFCKACRRYWTRGGALRKVPVGGGIRRNKRSKSSKNHSSLSSPSGTASASATSGTSSSPAAAALAPQLQPPFGSLHSLGRDRCSTIGASRLGFPGLSSSLHPPVDYHLGGGLGLDGWPLPPIQQFPFLTPANAVPPPPPGPSLMSSGSCPFEDAEAGNAEAASLAGQILASSSVPGSARLITQMASVKMDDNPPSAATSFPREFLGLGGSLRFWGNGANDAGADGGNGAGGTGVSCGGAAPVGAWSDLSAFNSPPSGNIP